MALDVYQIVTDKIVAMLESGTAPWRSPIMGRSSAGQPRNIDSKKSYRGINTFLLAFTGYAEGYESAFWGTFQQIKEKGGNVKKGSKATAIVFWKELEKTDESSGKVKKLPLLRYYNVFNLAQTEGLEIPDAPKWTPSQFSPIEACEQIVKGYADGPETFHEGQQAFYRPSDDTIRIPVPERFTSGEEYYGTRFHEMAHSSGHSKRLDRKLDTEPHRFGTPLYSQEELIAEMAACYLTAHAGITPATIENSAAYIQGWLKVLKADKKAAIAAASKAQKAADWILGERGPTAP